jgi:hypothetical protein
MEVRKGQVATSGHISWGGTGIGESLIGVRVAVTLPWSAGLRYTGGLSSSQS